MSNESNVVIPLTDLSCPLDPALAQIVGILESGRFVGGERVRTFEHVWAEETGASACVSVGSGTSALELTLRAVRLGYEDERTKVVVPGTSFVATVEAVYSNGLEPIVVDVDDRGLISPELVDEALEEHADEVLAIVPVHLYGQVAPVRRIEDLAEEYGIPYVVEDAAQAHGARYADGTPVGSRNPTCWSFMPAKILGAWGDAGAVTLDPPVLEDRIRRYADHGRLRHNLHQDPSTNSRMDAIQAAVLVDKIERGAFDKAVELRERLALFYNSRLGHLVRTQPHVRGRVWNYYVVWSTINRVERILYHLEAAGAETGSHYPYTLGNAFRGRPPTVLPNAERLAATAITLPLYPELSHEDQNLVIWTVEEVLS